MNTTNTTKELLRLLKEAERQDNMSGTALLVEALTEQAEEDRKKRQRAIEKYANKNWEDMTPLERGEAKTKLHQQKQAESRAQIAKGMAEVMEKRNTKARNYNNQEIE